VPSTRPYRIAAIALAALTIAPAAAGAHSRKAPDPIAHMAISSSACANANTPATQATKQEMRKAVVCLINQQRTSRHLPALREQPQLERSAQSWTNTMVLQNIFTHGTAFWNRISAVGYDWQVAGENIATGFSTPQQVVGAWMASAGHCRNILDPQYASVGTGVSSLPVLSAASGPATWTQDFGLTMTQTDPSHNWGPADRCSND
jgi:uncharacterized protein YkwD